MHIGGKDKALILQPKINKEKYQNYYGKVYRNALRLHLCQWLGV